MAANDGTVGTRGGGKKKKTKKTGEKSSGEMTAPMNDAKGFKGFKHYCFECESVPRKQNSQTPEQKGRREERKRGRWGR